MTQWLRQSTAATLKMGPFVDSTDGVTPETGLTISQADIRLSKNGGDYAQSNNAAGGTHDELGDYNIPLNTTDTNTLGRLKVQIQESGAVPVWDYFMVIPANIYDSMVLGTDNLEVDTTLIEGSDATTVLGVAQTGDSFVRIGVAGAGLTNIDLPNQTMDITGNLSGSVGSVTGAVGSVTAAVTTDAASRTASQATGFAVPGDEMNLADDAIKAAKYNQTDAHPIGSADTGATRIARTGADADTLETLSDQTDLQATLAEQAKIPKSDGSVTWNSTALASINTEVGNRLNTAIPGSVTAASMYDYMRRAKFAVCNRWDIDEATGDLDVYDDSNSLFLATAAAFTTLAGVTLRKKIL